MITGSRLGLHLQRKQQLCLDVLRVSGAVAGVRPFSAPHSQWEPVSATPRTWGTTENDEQPQLGTAACWEELEHGGCWVWGTELSLPYLGCSPPQLSGAMLGDNSYAVPRSQSSLKSALDGHEMILLPLKDALVMQGHCKCCCLAPVGSQAGGGKPGWGCRA